MFVNFEIVMDEVLPEEFDVILIGTGKRPFIVRLFFAISYVEWKF